MEDHGIGGVLRQPADGIALARVRVKQAQQKVYDVARGIHFDGAQYRRDIGFRAVKN